MKVAVLGSGVDALAVAADMSRHGRDTVLADFDDSRSDLEPVAARGGIVVSDADHPDHAGELHSVTVADDIAHAIDGAGLVTVVVPPGDHARAAAAIAPHVTADQTVLLVGDGSGAIVARRAIDFPILVAETNTVPCPARLTGPGEIATLATPGVVLIAVLPATPAGTAPVIDLISDVWPHATATDTVWSTALACYRAMARTVTTIAATGTLHDLTGAMLWAEGAVPEAATVMETVDSELLTLRQALNSREPRRYQDFLAVQAPAPAQSDQADSPDTPDTADPDIAESVSCSLVLASSLGAATGVPTPVVDGLVDVARPYSARTSAPRAARWPRWASTGSTPPA